MHSKNKNIKILLLISIIMIIFLIIIIKEGKYINKLIEEENYQHLNQQNENNERMKKDNSVNKVDLPIKMPKKINLDKKIKLNGINQEISVKTNDSSKPILLIIHGGPGFILRPLIEKCNSDLNDDYIVVNWDQRGAGKSFNKNIDWNTMNLKQFISDAHKLTKVLQKKYGKKKIYLMGHSFGTIIGLKLIKMYPDDYLGFISSGQVVSFADNEKYTFEFAYQNAISSSNIYAKDELEYIGEPDNNGRYRVETGYEITNSWMEYFGGDLYQKSSLDELYSIINEHPKYQDDIADFYQGIDFSQELFEDENVIDLDFRSEIKNVKVPVYFIIGVYDYDTPYNLVKEYYKLIKAPRKKLIEFKNSAHFPFYEESKNFNIVLKAIANNELQ